MHVLLIYIFGTISEKKKKQCKRGTVCISTIKYYVLCYNEEIQYVNWHIFKIILHFPM